MEEATKTEEPTGDDKPVTIRLGDLKELVAQVIDEAKAQVKAEVNEALEAEAAKVKAIYGIQSDVNSQIQASNQAMRQEGYKKLDESAEAMGRKAVPNTLVAQDSNSPLYGNLDTQHQFDLRKLTSLRELPTDKIVVLLPQYNRNSKGEATGFDVENCRVQFFDIDVYRSHSTTDASTGTTTFQLMQVETIPIHDPSLN